MCLYLSMRSPQLVKISLFMVVLVAFVYFGQPICAKADQPTLDYTTTSQSLNEVKAYITGMEAAIIPLVFIVIGFIALTYCTLRNVNVPLQYDSNISFIDKCSELGHYVFDNATEDIKNVLYSVATFVASGQITDPNSVSSTLPFLLTSVGRFFAAFGTWLNSSFIYNVQPLAKNLLELFQGNPLEYLRYSSYDYIDAYITAFNSVNDGLNINQSNFVSYFVGDGISQIFILDSDINLANVYVIFNQIGFGFYTLDNGVFNRTLVRTLGGSFVFANSGYNVRPNKSSYDHNTISYTNYYNFVVSTGYVTAFNTLNSDFLLNLYNRCLGFYSIDSASFSNSYVMDNVGLVEFENPVGTWSDQIYTPTDDQIEVDIDNVADRLGEGATIGSLAALIALLTQDKALTLGTAITDVQQINSAGDYAFPSMDNIWKYPKYFFDTLHGWGAFVKGCLGAVTVGDGGLSWIFYGGFVLLICGGIIGKILLG